MSYEHSDYLRNGNLRTPNAAVWLEIADHIDAQAAENAALRARLAEVEKLSTELVLTHHFSAGYSFIDYEKVVALRNYLARREDA